MSVQFSPLDGFTAPIAGWYWKHSLGDEWASVDQAGPVQDQFERFDSDTGWSAPEIKLAIASTPEPVRIQLLRRDQDRMIQVQRTRFMYNWRRQGDSYPSYQTLRPEFDAHYAEFVRFIDHAALGSLEPNQWEMTYVNHVEKGQLWQTPTDWERILPGFYTPCPAMLEYRFESFGGEWHLAIEPDRGRLHVAIQHARIESAKGPEVLMLQLTARGPIDTNQGWDLDSGFNVGHEAIVRAFAAMTSKAAHDHWGRRI